MQFPDVDAESLDGVHFVFPRDFRTPTIGLVAFDLQQRAELESWVPFVDGYARGGTADGRVFPVLPRSMRMMKGVILTTLRKGAPNPEARAATVPLFVDVDAFCTALDIRDRALIAALVIAPGGAILAHQSGPYTESAAAAIRAHLTPVA